MKKLFLMLALLFGSMIHVVNAVEDPVQVLKGLLTFDRSPDLREQSALYQALVAGLQAVSEAGKIETERWIYIIMNSIVGSSVYKSQQCANKNILLELFLDHGVKLSLKNIKEHTFDTDQIKLFIEKKQWADGHLIVNIMSRESADDESKSDLIKLAQQKGFSLQTTIDGKNLIDFWLSKRRADHVFEMMFEPEKEKSDIRKCLDQFESLGFPKAQGSLEFLKDDQENSFAEIADPGKQLKNLLKEHLAGTDKTSELAVLLKKHQSLVNTQIGGYSIFDTIVLDIECSDDLKKKTLEVFLDAGMKLSDDSLQKAAEKYPIIFKCLLERGLYKDMLKKSEGRAVVLTIQFSDYFKDEEKEAWITKCKNDGFDFNKKFEIPNSQSMSAVDMMLVALKKCSKDLKTTNQSSSQKEDLKKTLSAFSSAIKSAVAHGATITPEMQTEAEKLGLNAEIFVAPVNVDGGSSGSTIGSGKMIGGVVVIAGIAAAVYFYFKLKKDAAKKKKTVPKKADQKEIDINEENKTIREMNKKQEGALHLATV